MTPKRKRAVSQDMGFSLGDMPMREKRVYLGPLGDLDKVSKLTQIPDLEQQIRPLPTQDRSLNYDFGVFRDQDTPMPLISVLDRETQPLNTPSQADYMNRPEPFVEITQAQCKADPDAPMDCGQVYGTGYGYNTSSFNFEQCQTEPMDMMVCDEIDGIGHSSQFNRRQCKAEPHDLADFDYGTGCDFDQYIDHAPYEVTSLHPDVDLAMDNNYANDNVFLPVDSNMAHDLPSMDVNIEPAYIIPSKPRKLLHVTLRSGKTIALTPWQRINPRSYYDELTYEPKSTSYKFTTAAQLLHPKAFDEIGWSPEHYAGLTNRITVPSSAYIPRPRPSASDPIRRTVYTTNHDLARMVGWMRKRIRIMYQQGTGLVHPAFPTTWAAAALLTESELDSLAAFYHQTGVWNRWWLHYPCPVVWRREDCVWVKRRKMMEFIGIRKPEKPPVEVVEWLDKMEDAAQRLMTVWKEKEEMERKMFWLRRM